MVMEFWQGAKGTNIASIGHVSEVLKSLKKLTTLSERQMSHFSSIPYFYLDLV